MRTKKWLVVCFATLLTFGVVSGCDSSKSSTKVSESKNGKEKAESKSVALEIESAQFVLPEEYEKPVNGRVLQVNVNVKNIGKEAFQLSQRNFSLYEGDKKMKEYYSADTNAIKYDDIDTGKQIAGTLYFDVKEADSYELVFKKERLNPEKEKEEKLTFKIDGKELKKKIGELNRPGDSLAAYINAIFYDKDVEKVKELSGDDGQEVINAVKDGLNRTLQSELGFTLDQQIVDTYFIKLKAAIQEKVKFEVTTASMENDGRRANVEIKGNPLLVYELQSKLQTEANRIATENPEIAEEELIKKIFEYQTSILHEAPVSPTEKVVKLQMEKHGKDQWRVSGLEEEKIVEAIVTFQ